MIEKITRAEFEEMYIAPTPADQPIRMRCWAYPHGKPEEGYWVDFIASEDGMNWIPEEGASDD